MNLDFLPCPCDLGVFFFLYWVSRQLHGYTFRLLVLDAYLTSHFGRRFWCITLNDEFPLHIFRISILIMLFVCIMGIATHLDWSCQRLSSLFSNHACVSSSVYWCAWFYSPFCLEADFLAHMMTTSAATNTKTMPPVTPHKMRSSGRVSEGGESQGEMGGEGRGSV